MKNTKTVLISATSWDAEKTLVYGYNHEEYNSALNVISYGPVLLMLTYHLQIGLIRNME
jgi:hypothetical protein